MKRATVRHIPFRMLGSNEAHLRYLEEDGELKPFLGLRPRTAEELFKRAPVNARRLLPPAQLAAALHAYGERHGAPPAAQAAASAIGEGAFVVVTGQQPGLLAGPLYTIHKVATAVRLARDLSALPGAPRVVPMFWNHTDDHDFDEVNRAFLVNANQDVQRLRLDLGRSGEPIREIGVGRAMEAVLAAAGDLLPASEFREWAFALFEPRHPDENLGAQLARVLYALFGDFGLVMCEPRDLPEPAFDVLGRWWEQIGTIQKHIRANSDDLQDIGIDPGLDPASTLMFLHSAGRRIALAEDDDAPRVTALSPGALLRPLWQDACLPTLGFVVGPGELAYLAVAGPLYRALGVPQPVFVPRASLTLVEPSLAKLLKRFHWDLPDLEKGPDTLVAELPAEATDTLETELETLLAEVKSKLGTIGARLGDADKNMLGPLERARDKVGEELTKFMTKLKHSRQNRAGTGLRQVKRLCSNLRPRDRMQERVLPALMFLVTHGKELGPVLVDAADPFQASHAVLEL